MLVGKGFCCSSGGCVVDGDSASFGPCPSSSLPPLFLFGLPELDRPGTGACSIFSCALLAELCVGRIIRAKNDPSGALTLAVLVRALAFCVGLLAAGRDGRDEVLRRDGLVFVPTSRAVPPEWTRFDPDVFGPAAPPVRLRGLGSGASPVFAAEEAVAAVAPAGSRTGRVGDFGRILGVGEDEPGFFTGLAVGGLPGRFFDAGAVVAFAPDVAWGCFGIEAFLISFPALFEVFGGTACLGDAAFTGGWRLVVSGELGVLGDFFTLVGDDDDIFAGSVGPPRLVSIAGGRDEPDCDLGGGDVFEPKRFLGWPFGAEALGAAFCLGGDDSLSGIPVA